ncbi:hypothetical protein AB0J83_30925 [Actinoplanes sp. NPDC049596]|uniref:hypothetical protein n=1 Tax=unclassified Actinoplanes TaxID=2626549 RepID=UPI00343F4805
MKLRHAATHLGLLRVSVEAYGQAQPWRVETEPGRQPGEVAYRLRIDQPIPAEIAVVAGDVVHALRSALDTVVYDLARRHTGTLTRRQETKPAFGSRIDEQAFEELEAKLRGLCGDRGVAAVRAVQPFSFAAEASRLGVEMNYDSAGEPSFDVPSRLNVLWNIDKHRRLLRLGWYPDLLYWQNEESKFEPARVRPGEFIDGCLLGYFQAAANHPGDTPTFQFRLHLSDDPVPEPEDICEALTSWHQTLGTWVVPRMFLTASSDDPPPMLIAGDWPYR